MGWGDVWKAVTKGVSDVGDFISDPFNMHHDPPVNIPLGPNPTGGAGGMGRMNTGQMTTGMQAFMPGPDWSKIDPGAFEQWVRGLPGGSAVWDAVASGAGALGSLGSFVLKNKDAFIDAFKIYGGIQAQNKANEYGQRALDLAEKRYNAGEPLRTAAIPGMFNAQRANPFARDALPVAYGGMGGTPTPVAGAPAYGSGVGNAIMRSQGAPPPSTNNPIPETVAGTTNPQRTLPIAPPAGPAVRKPTQIAPIPMSNP